MKLMNSMQKYPHITELFACTQKILAFIFSFPINSLISSGIFNTEAIEINNFIFLQNKQSNVYQYLHIHEGSLCMPDSLFF